MKKYLSLASLLFAISFNAQLLEKTAIGIGYRYTGRNVLQAGPEFRWGDTNYKSVIIGASLLYTRISDNDKFLPEAHIYYTNNGPLYGVSVNPYSIEPRIGISLFNAFFLNTGYAFPISGEKYFKGITVGVQLNIAPKNSKFYDYMKIM